MAKKRLCIYHNDADGRMSAAIYRRYLINKGVVIAEECEFIEACHSKKLEIMKDIFIGDKEPVMFDEIVVLDFSFENHEMDYLRCHCKNPEDFHWIDHHISAKEKYPLLWDSKRIGGIRDIEYSAAELTWKVFVNEEMMPSSVQLVGDYDTWKFKLGDATKYFAEANRYYDVNDFVHILNDRDYFLEEIGKGEILYEAKLQRIKDKIQGSYIKEIQFKEYTCGLINNSEYQDGSHLGNEICKLDYDISLAFTIKENKVIFSLRCIREDIDLSKIAEEFGGGGHKKAAGFVSPLKEGLNFIKTLYLGGY